MHDAGRRDQHQGGEHARDFQLVARFEDAPGQPRGVAAGPGHELRHHRADQRQAARDAQPAQEVRQRRRQAQIDQGAPATGAVELEQVEQVAVDGAQAEDGVRQDGEEGHQPGADQQRQLDVVGPHDDQRRDRHDRRDLQDDRIGKERELDPARQREQDGEQAADRDRGGQRLERDAHGDQQRGRQRAPVGDQRLRHQDRAGQDVGLDAGGAHDALPQGEHQDAQHDRRDHLGAGHAAIASPSRDEACRHQAAYSAEVRKPWLRG